MQQLPGVYSVGQAAQLFGVHEQTIRQWANAGKLQYFRTPTGQRRIVTNDTRTVATDEPQQQHKTKEGRYKAVYCRVSSSKQKDDLQRQIQHMSSLYPEHRVYSDIGSGINFKRKALVALLDDALGGLVEEVVVASRDRLCRFAFELFEWLFQRGGTKITVLQQGDGTPESELAEDVLSVIQVFCCRRNGKRRYGNKSTKGEVAGNEKSEESAA